VQAPKVRTTPREPRGTRTILIAAGVVAVLVAAILGFLLLGGGDGNGSDAAVAETIRDAGGELETLQAAPNFMVNGRKLAFRHIPNGGDQLPKGFKYNSTPPTSGIHTDGTVIYGIYDQPVPVVSTVHNLEHGAIVIRYGPRVPDGEIQKIRDFYLDDPNGLVVAPMPGLGDTIALSAWTFDQGRQNDRTYEGEGHLAKLKRFDEDAFAAFRDAFRGHGPEPFKVSDLKPGGP
jgi:hypothetical protein